MVEEKYGFKTETVEPVMREVDGEEVQTQNADGELMYSVEQGDGSVWQFSKENVAGRVTRIGTKKEAVDVPVLSGEPTDEEQSAYDAAIAKQDSNQQSIDEFQALLDSFK